MVVALTWLIGAAADGRAADWSLASTLGTTGVFDDNLSLQPVPAGDAYGLLNNLSIDLLARNPTSVLGFANNFSYRDYAGKGKGATGQFGGLNSDSTLSFDKTSKLTDLSLAASLSRQNANSSELTDTGVVTTDVTRLAYTFDGGLVHRVNRRNSLSLSATAAMVDFIGPASALTPSRTLSTSASWHYKGTKRTEARLSLGADWFVADNPAENENLSWSATAGVTSRLTKALSFEGEIGPILTRSSAIDLATPAMARETQLDPGYVVNASLTYALKRTALTFTADHGVSPGSLGNLQTRTSFGFEATHAINDLENVSLLARYSELTQGASSGSAAGPARKFLTISPTYSYRLTRHLKADLAYKYVQVRSLAGTATSNSVMLTFSRDFVLLP